MLQEHGPLPSVVLKDWPVVAQFSSIGSLGPTSDHWLSSEWLSSLAKCKSKGIFSSAEKFPQLQLVRKTVTRYT